MLYSYLHVKGRTFFFAVVFLSLKRRINQVRQNQARRRKLSRKYLGLSLNVAIKLGCLPLRIRKVVNRSQRISLKLQKTIQVRTLFYIFQCIGVKKLSKMIRK